MHARVRVHVCVCVRACVHVVSQGAWLPGLRVSLSKSSSSQKSQFQLFTFSPKALARICLRMDVKSYSRVCWLINPTSCLLTTAHLHVKSNLCTIFSSILGILKQSGADQGRCWYSELTTPGDALYSNACPRRGSQSCLSLYFLLSIGLCTDLSFCI